MVFGQFGDFVVVDNDGPRCHRCGRVPRAPGVMSSEYTSTKAESLGEMMTSWVPGSPSDARDALVAEARAR